MIRVFHKFFLIVMLISLSTLESLVAQELIEIINASFEGKVTQGKTNFIMPSWYDCDFDGDESVPDVHGVISNFYGVTTIPFNGKSFVGLVARESETNEAIVQKLSTPLISGYCYKFSIHLCSDYNYKSKTEINGKVSKEKKPFNTPIKLIIWGGNSFCSKTQKLGETEAVNSSDWKEHLFRFTSKENHQYITLEAFWLTPILLPYNGNILLDQMSSIVQTNCNNQNPSHELIASSTSLNRSYRNDPYQNQGKATSTPNDLNTKDEITSKKTKKTSSTVVKEISGTKVSDFLTSQKELRVKELIFEADTFNLHSSSYSTLDEIYYFLEQNNSIQLEIAGHTNGLPPHNICDTLSYKRANAVKTYIVNKGIDESRIIAIGYGKRKPLVSNKTSVGRDRNQRVEIKIIRQ